MHIKQSLIRVLIGMYKHSSIIIGEMNTGHIIIFIDIIIIYVAGTIGDIKYGEIGIGSTTMIVAEDIITDIIVIFKVIR